SELTGSPRVPRRWVALVSRHNDRQPAPSRARKVTRGSRGSTLAPPRAGARRACDARIRGGTGPPTAVARAGGSVVSKAGAIARSTPKIGRTPADRQARANFTAP